MPFSSEYLKSEVAGIVKISREMNIPLAAHGGGTGLSAGCFPAPNGAILKRFVLGLRVVLADGEIVVEDREGIY